MVLALARSARFGVPGVICAAVLLYGADRPAGGAPATKTDGSVRWVDVPHTDTVFAPPKYGALDEWKARRTWLVDQVRFASGLWPAPERTPLNAHVFGKLDRGDYTIEKVWFESRPGFLVTGNLYRPAKTSGKVPAIACPHGHWQHGRLEHTDKCSVPGRCITLARMGAVVFAYDMVGYNDSKRQLDHKDPLLFKPENSLWGIGPFELQTLNGVRVLDFLQSLPEVDPARIGVTGASGGGTQTFILTAIDERVTVSAPINMISSVMQGGCTCENAQTLRIDTNNMDIGALAAPRPMLMISATGDWTKNTPTVEFPAVRAVYGLYRAADRVSNTHIDAPHNYNLQSREAMYGFMAKWLFRGGAGAVEGEICAEKDEDLLVFADGKTPDAMRPFAQVVEDIKQDAVRQIEALKPTDRKKLDRLRAVVVGGLQHAVGSKWPAGQQVTAVKGTITGPANPDATMSTFIRAGRPVAVATIEGKEVTRAVFCVDTDGRFGAARHQTLTARGVARRAQVAFAEPFTTGANVADPNAKTPRGSTKFFTTFNRTDAAEAVFDLLTALSVMPQGAQQGRSPETGFVAFGRMGPVTLAARAMMPERVVRKTNLRTVIDMNGFDCESDEAYLKELNLPNIRKLGGVKALVAAAANGPIWLHNVGERFPVEWAEQAGRLNGVKVRVTRETASDEAIADYLFGGR